MGRARVGAPSEAKKPEHRRAMASPQARSSVDAISTDLERLENHFRKIFN